MEACLRPSTTKRVPPVPIWPPHHLHTSGGEEREGRLLGSPRGVSNPRLPCSAQADGSWEECASGGAEGAAAALAGPDLPFARLCRWCGGKERLCKARRGGRRGPHPHGGAALSEALAGTPRGRQRRGGSAAGQKEPGAAPPPTSSPSP